VIFPHKTNAALISYAEKLFNRLKKESIDSLKITHYEQDFKNLNCAKVSERGHEKMKMKIAIVTPVYNDWESFNIMIERLGRFYNNNDFQLIIFAVDDASTDKIDTNNLKNVIDLQIIHLKRNLGHQRAICIALSYIEKNNIDINAVVVMDCDGEDKIEDIFSLINQFNKDPDKIIFAKRERRSEGFLFKIFYTLYKISFKLLTGNEISFGNFCLIPYKLLQHVVTIPEIWNHFSAGIMRSRSPFISIPTSRGKRFAGASKMNFASLLMHGLSAIAVYIDIVLVRVLIGCTLMMIISSLGIFTTFIIRIFTDLAIPGWASIMVTGFSIMFIQIFLVSLILSFFILHMRMQPLFIPILEFEKYIFNIEFLKEDLL